jgi:acetyltransferase-like isoleucine patch superfamily enzyme
MRRVERFAVQGSSSLWQLYRILPFIRVFWQTGVIMLARFIPWFGVKNWLYRTLLGMRIGQRTAIAFMVMLDILYPQKISIGENSIIGYNTTILSHEYLINEYRIGEVIIGNEVMIGANTTILPGVTIGDRAVVGAGAVITRDIPPDHFAFGNPLQVRPR